MNLTRRPTARWLILAILLALDPAPSTRAESLRWHPDQNRLDARVESWPLLRVLEVLAGETGWAVYLDPGASGTVTAQFQDRPSGEAIRRLVGRHNFALLPQQGTNPTRLYVFQQSLADATRRVMPREIRVGTAAAERIRNELLVIARPGALSELEPLLEQLGGRVVARAGDTVRVAFETPEAAEAARAALTGSESVASVDSNYRYWRTTPTDPITPGTLPSLGLRPRSVSEGDYVVVALIDSPVLTTDSRLQEFLLEGISVVGANDLPAGELSHGTAMAETILRGLATTPQDPTGTPVRILPIDIYGPNPSTTTFDVANGLQAAAAAGAAVINLSLGTDTDNPYLHRLIQDLAAQGPLVIAAAGNEPVTTPVFPAAYPEVLAVTAGDAYGRVAPYANRGDFVDAIAPGTVIIHQGGQAYIASGTSYATAYTSGLAAGMASTSDKPVQALAADIVQHLHGPASVRNP